MRNLKKVLALVVAVAMIASMGLVASAANYSDVAANAAYADAVNLLSNLGIITGYEDGTFKPDNTVTRAEAATMIVRMLGLDDEVEAGETNFTDVAADNWASGYVNVAEANGIVNGMGDGTFNPNGEVTYGQIVKMIVCALGYEPVALAHGGYLGGGYLYAGSSQVTGFTKGVAGTANAAASRATVARLIYNALEVELMDQTSFSTGINGSTYEVLENETILSEYLGLEKVDAVVTKTYLSSAVYDAEADKEVELMITKNYAKDDADYEVTGSSQAFLAEGTDAATLLGYTVTAYVGETEEGDDAIFAIAPKAKKNSTLVLDADLIVEDGLTETSVKYFKSESAKSTTEAEIQNFVEIKGIDEEDAEVLANIVVNGFNADYDLCTMETVEMAEEVEFLDNDGDGDFEFIFVTVPSQADAVEFVVAEVESDDNVWTWTNEDVDGAEFEIDADDETVLYTIVKDGKIVDADAIVEGDVITVLDTDVNVITVYVSSKVVEGTVDEVDDDVYTIAGGEYEVSPISAEEVGEIEAGDEGLFYINATGKIAYIDTVKSIASTDYVFVIDADVKDGSFSKDEYLVKVVTAAGAVEVLTIKSKKVDVYTAEAELEELTAEEAYEEIKDYVGIARIDVTAAGELSTIYLPDSEDDFATNAEFAELDETAEYNEARGTYGKKLDLTADVLVFHIDTTEKTVEDEIDYEEAVTVTTVGALFVDESSYKFTAYGEEEEVPGVLVVEDAKAALDSENPVMVVTKVSNVVADEDPTIKVTGLVAGKTVSVIVDPEEKLTKEDVEKGNVILFAEAGDFVTDVEVLFTSDAEGVGALTTEDLDDIVVGTMDEELVSIHYGAITEKTAKTVTIDDEKFWFGDDVNVTVVDYSGASVEITKGSLSSVKESTEKSEYTLVRTAFVKTVAEGEDVVAEIVVFVERVDAE